MPTPIEHFSAITLATLQDLQNKGILRLMKDATSMEPLAIDSPEAQKMITNITASIYEGVVKEMNIHLALDLS